MIKLTDLQIEVYNVLQEAAAKGMVCPSDQVIAKCMGRQDAGTISTAVYALNRKDAITLEKVPGARIVTINRTGESTRLPDDLGPRMFGDGVTITDGKSTCFWCGTAPDGDDKFKCRRCK